MCFKRFRTWSFLPSSLPPFFLSTRCVENNVTFINYIYLAVLSCVCFTSDSFFFFWQCLPRSSQYRKGDGKIMHKQSACNYCLRCSKRRGKLNWEAVACVDMCWPSWICTTVWKECKPWHTLLVMVQQRKVTEEETGFQLPLQGECVFSNLCTCMRDSSCKSSLLAALIFLFSCLEVTCTEQS